jgi:hypothetical protein
MPVVTSINTRFTTNWNGKLACQYFTTIRLYNEAKYQHELLHDIWFKNEHFGRARVVDTRKITIDQVNDWMGFLDTGYDGKKTQQILRRMYGKMKQPVLLHWVMFRWEERYLVPQFISNDQK